ncbi:hypothetical protein [Marinivivus vitaminiproducens]|uniref:hypothetical protein n=1 Tax=Marinivivus vitaminiproducens TaxID=3035935 RepID=UPI0027A2AD2B|nr:dATP pyrophosphohydrolase [Geminicoccaceae bacterium SCSIO 64248]
MPNADPLRVVPVEGRRAMAAFIDLPRRLYRGRQGFVPPLALERRMSLDPKKAAFFEHATAQYFLAYRGDRPVGRISAQIDRLHLEAHDPEGGQFGLIEATDDPAVFAALLDAAEGWLRERGMRRASGPFSLSINEECGLLVDGFDEKAMLLQGWSPPYAAARIEERGYAGVKDLIGYIYDPASAPPIDARRLLERTGASDRVTVRKADLKSYADEIRILVGLFNEAWADNWGFLPFTEKELKQLADGLRPLVQDDLVWIASMGGEPACMVVALPDLNEAIADLDGRLLPIGWAKLLWRLKVKGLRQARVPLMGLARRHHRTVLGSALLILVLESLRQALQKRGYTSVELSWILEDNGAMNTLARSIGARPYKTWRLFQKELA